MKKLNTNEVIKKCIKVHGNKYDYSQLVYSGYKEKINIMCHIHGIFSQRCDKHLSVQGCPKCKQNTHKKHNETKRGMSFEDFVTQTKLLYDNSYEYDQKSFVNISSKMKIFCKKCNEWFEQSPKDHLKGCGCRKCGFKKLSIKNCSNIIEFIEKARKIHGDKYDYSKAEYVNAKIKICIICPEHGEFWMKPNVHLNNCGCPKCKQSHMEKEYQGEQHFKPFRWENNEEKLKLRQTRDKIKKELCEKHNISIYYINYNENIKEKLIKLIHYVLD